MKQYETPWGLMGVHEIRRGRRDQKEFDGGT